MKVVLLLVGTEVWRLEEIYAAIRTVVPSLTESDWILSGQSIFNLFQFGQRLDTIFDSCRSQCRNSWDSAPNPNFESECTLPLDRVHGAMGLFNEQLRLEPDYTSTHEEPLRRLIQKQVFVHWCPYPGKWSGILTILLEWRTATVRESCWTW